MGKGERPTGQRIAAQLKSPTNPTWDGGRTAHRLKVSTLNSLLQAPDPAALILYGKDRDAFFWTDLRRFAHERLKTDGVSWQDQATVSVPVCEEHKLSDDAAFFDMVERLWTASDFGLADVEDEQHRRVREACREILPAVLERGHVALEEATTTLSETLGRPMTPETATKLLENHAPGLWTVDERDQAVRAIKHASLEGLRSAFHIAREDAPTILHRFGWLATPDLDDIGRLAARYVAEQGHPVELLDGLRDASPQAWVQALTVLLSSHPKHLTHLQGIRLTEDRRPPVRELPSILVREIAFTNPTTQAAAREGLGPDAGRGIILVPSRSKTYLVETKAPLSPEDPPPRLRVHGADGPGLTSRTPIIVLDEPETRWVCGLRGILPDPERPAIRVLTSQKPVDVESARIDGIPLLFLGGQQEGEEVNPDIPAPVLGRCW